MRPLPKKPKRPLHEEEPSIKVIEYSALIAERERSKKLLEALKRISHATYFCEAHRIDKEAWTATEAKQAIADYESQTQEG